MSGYEWEDPDPVFQSHYEGVRVVRTSIVSPEQYAGREVLTHCEAPRCPHVEDHHDVVCGRPARHEGKCWRVTTPLFDQTGVICPAPDLSGCL